MFNNGGFNPYAFTQNYPYQNGYNVGSTNYTTQMQNTQQQAQTNIDWIRVNSMEDVGNITVQPNTKAWIMLSSEPIFVLKSADGMGLTTTDAYRFEKITGEQKPEYVTRQEFDEFKKLFEPEGNDKK